MNFLRLFRHGPMVFWLATAIVTASLSIAALQVGTNTPPPPTLSDGTAWDQVAGWRSSLAQLPLAAAGGEVSSLGTELATSAERYAEEASEAGRAELAAAWSAAYEAADELASTAAEDAGQLQASIRRVGLAGDRLLATVSGVAWVPADLPPSIPISGDDESLIDGLPGPTG